MESDLFSTLNTRLTGYEETTLSEEYSSELIFNWNDEPHKRIMFNINHLAINPVWQSCQLWTNLHLVSNLWFHLFCFYCFYGAKIQSISDSSKLLFTFLLLITFVTRCDICAKVYLIKKAALGRPCPFKKEWRCLIICCKDKHIIWIIQILE